MAPGMASDSIHGSVMVTPTLRRNLRRENRCWLIINWGFAVQDFTSIKQTNPSVARLPGHTKPR